MVDATLLWSVVMSELPQRHPQLCPKRIMRTGHTAVTFIT